MVDFLIAPRVTHLAPCGAPFPLQKGCHAPKSRHAIRVPWRDQYSDGRSSVVALRSASVMIQSLVPFDRVHEESSRQPSASERIVFPAVVFVHLPQSPARCRRGSGWNSRRPLPKSLTHLAWPRSAPAETGRFSRGLQTPGELRRSPKLGNRLKLFERERLEEIPARRRRGCAT